MLPHLASAPNINHLWAALLVEELVRQGTTFFVVCPGSRSTPLAVAVAQNPRAEALVHWDERAAGFVALGWGRATGKPAAVVTTSGTAVANLLPAAVEADADGVPLLLITADRPPELRETGANQTIRQPPIFQDVARWTLDWPVPTTDVSPRWVLSTTAHAVHRAASGPVHLNLPFREPLGGQPDGLDAEAVLASVPEWAGGRGPFSTAVPVAVSPKVPAGLWDRLGAARSGLVVMGEAGDGAEAAGRIADALGWPLVVDLRATGPRTLHDLILTSERFREAHRPEAVVHVGGRLTSKRLMQHLAASRPATYVHLDARPGRLDPDGLVTHRVTTSAAEVPATEGGASEATRGWEVASEAVRSTLDRHLGPEAELSEPAVARLLARLPEGWRLVAAASMPVRDLDAYTEAVGVVANRGASGIDGTVATAHGAARGTGRPVAALVGDLALLHDQTSLALLRSGPPVVVVVINNDGGGIFHRLPIASGSGALAGDTFERFFGTPHGLTFEHAATQVGLAYHAPDTVEKFEQALDAAAASGASALIEVRTDREEQAALRRRIEAACARAVDATLA